MKRFGWAGPYKNKTVQTARSGKYERQVLRQARGPLPPGSDRSFSISFCNTLHCYIKNGPPGLPGWQGLPGRTAGPASSTGQDFQLIGFGIQVADNVVFSFGPVQKYISYDTVRIYGIAGNTICGDRMGVRGSSTVRCPRRRRKCWSRIRRRYVRGIPSTKRLHPGCLGGVAQSNP